MSKLITLFFSLTVIFTSIYPEKIYLKPPQFESKIESLMDIHSGKRKLEASGTCSFQKWGCDYNRTY